MRAPAEAGPASARLVEEGREIVPPGTETERTLTDLWEQVFETSPISIDDDFFMAHRGLAQALLAQMTREATPLIYIHLPVVADGVLAGIVSIGDVVKAMMAQQRDLIADLERYITG